MPVLQKEKAGPDPVIRTGVSERIKMSNWSGRSRAASEPAVEELEDVGDGENAAAGEVGRAAGVGVAGRVAVPRAVALRLGGDEALDASGDAARAAPGRAER